MTKLEGPLRRELALSGERYTLTITPDGLTLVPKGRRKGYQLAWQAFIDGEAALAVALNASLANGPSSRAAAKGDLGKGNAKPQMKKVKSTAPVTKNLGRQRRFV
jgi:hypothetical protein